MPQELARGADGIMTGFAYPEMLVSVSVLFAAGRSDEAAVRIYLPLVRHEQQPGFGLAVRKEILRRRGAIRSAAVRAPGSQARRPRRRRARPTAVPPRGAPERKRPPARRRLAIDLYGCVQHDSFPASNLASYVIGSLQRVDGGYIRSI